MIGIRGKCSWRCCCLRSVDRAERSCLRGRERRENSSTPGIRSRYSIIIVVRVTLCEDEASKTGSTLPIIILVVVGFFALKENWEVIRIRCVRIFLFLKNLRITIFRFGGKLGMIIGNIFVVFIYEIKFRNFFIY